MKCGENEAERSDWREREREREREHVKQAKVDYGRKREKAASHDSSNKSGLEKEKNPKTQSAEGTMGFIIENYAQISHIHFYEATK